MMSNRFSGRGWLAVGLISLAAVLVGSQGGCDSSAGSHGTMVKDPPPAPPDELSSDNMPTSKKNRARYPNFGKPKPKPKADAKANAGSP